MRTPSTSFLNSLDTSSVFADVNRRPRNPQHVLAAELFDRVRDQSRVNRLQGRGVPEHHVSRNLRLPDCPVVTVQFQATVRIKQRVDAPSQRVQEPLTLAAHQSVEHLLSAFHVVDPGEAIVPLLEADPGLLQPSRQVLATVDANLNRERQPGLQPHVHQSELTIEEDNISQCLSSGAGLFDEMVVVDTGSKDRTREIAGEFGARVFDFDWVDDFAAARNAALALATGDYAFWLDADDVVDPTERDKLRELLEGLRGSGGMQIAAEAPGGATPTPPAPPLQGGECSFVGPVDARATPPAPALQGGEGSLAAYVVRCSCDPPPNGDGGQTVVDHIRLFPVREDVRWSYAVHEQILPALRRAKVPVQWTDITVRHTGYTDRALRERKLQRDRKILEAELAERPGDPFVLFNLGFIAVERQDWQTSLGYLHGSLRGSAPSDSIVRKLFALIARCHQTLGNLPAALGACAEGLRLDPDDSGLHFRKAILHRTVGQPAEAEACFRRIFSLKRPDRFCSVDQGI